jgi:predicted pyridoxine 5'-phosphate oxidase superfamily flavin-nucleotide-binding protein
MTAGRDTPFHDGERRVQDRAGTRARMDVAGPRLIRDHMPDQHRELFEKLPYLIAGAADASGQPWATLLTGEPGFVTTTAQDMRLAALPDPLDPVHDALLPGAAIGFLGIEMTTRRRNRMNGRVRELTGAGFAVDVVQSFGNCPKYIHVRQHQRLTRTRAVARQVETAILSAQARALIEGADTFFIATTSGRQTDDRTQGTDVSHRGGEAGFVTVETRGGGTRLLVPDYVGNGFFNTLGNLALDPRAGLLFVDFARGHLLQLAARADVVWQDAAAAAATGAARILVLEIAGGQWLCDAIDLRWA